MKKHSGTLAKLIEKYNILANPSRGIPKLNSFGNPTVILRYNSNKRFRKN